MKDLESFGDSVRFRGFHGLVETTFGSESDDGPSKRDGDKDRKEDGKDA